MLDDGGPSRRSVLALAAAALLPAACSGEDGAEPGSSPAPAATGASPEPSASPSPTTLAAPATAGPLPAVAALEKDGAKAGVFVWDTGSGRAHGHRLGERFAMCSTFKTLVAGAVLKENGLAGLSRAVPSGQTLEQLCAAAVERSDNPSANLLLAQIGEAKGLTAYVRTLGDEVTRLDRPEPDLNEARPGDPRDTTTPAAMAASYAALLLGDALGAPERDQLKAWLVASTTGAERIRSVTPKGWTIAHKTGTGGYGTANDVAVLWPPDAAPVVLAVFTRQAQVSAWPDDALVANAAKAALDSLA